MTADSPDDRKRSFARCIVKARRASEPVVFETSDATIEYDDRSLRLELTSAEQDRLKGLLESYHVFKIEQPQTRKADSGVVYLSAVTDAKHAADFIEALFRTVYALDEGYQLRE